MSRPTTIVKDPARLRLPPNYQPEQSGAFSWEQARKQLAGLPAGRGLNIAHEAVDRHVMAGRGDKVALRFVKKSGAPEDLSYTTLQRRTNRFANALRALKVAPGERVFSLLGRQPELYVAALGALKAKAVFCPLFSAFGPEPITTRMSIGEARVLVTTAKLYDKKVRPIRAALPALRHVILVGEGAVGADGSTLAWSALLDTASDRFEIPPTSPEDPSIMHFTSGTTGKPKGALHVHGAVVVHQLTGRVVLDLHDDDVFWCTADPGWVTGTSYGIIAPLTCGVTSVVDEADFDAERWYRILDEQKVSVWYTAPTAVRMLMKAGAEVPKRFDLSSLRFAGSVGEPLNPEAVWWGAEVLGLPFHDNWWQTETGGIMIANLAALPIKPGSMGKPIPGIEAAVVEKSEDGKHVTVLGAPDVEGELALRPGWPSMFRQYVKEEERTRKCFVDGWYLTGDLVKKDADGYFWFVGRADDVIKSSGHLIGPFEVESALMEHPAVAEAGVIGVPDAVAGNLIKAFVVLRPGQTANEALNFDVLGFARTRLGPTVAPKTIAFVADLPKTKSGKIMRRLLKARELGLPEGDTSTLEGAAT
ncbi:MAG: acetate--CoA ligase [Deltaproteobacteria bacterium]|nr:acetate--CoA ligase [Deltaproteobacteria bacterium]